MSKQIAFSFLVLPSFLCVIESFRQPQSSVRNSRLLQLTAMAASVAAVAVPWLMVNFSWIKGYSQENVSNMVSLGVTLTPWGIFTDYLVGAMSSMSPLLTTCFVIALLALKKRQHQDLLPVYLSAAGGLIFLSLLTMTFPLDRYISTCLVACAVATACGVQNISVNPWWRASLALVGMLAFFQFVSFAYTPYPIQNTTWLYSVSSKLGVELREFRGIKIYRSVPADGGLNWGQNWTLDEIRKVDGAQLVWLNILPSQGFYNPHSFELLARERGMTVKPTTSRVWTIMGDKVDFKPETALYFHWYLLKSGDQGNKLRDIESEKNYQDLISFLKSSGRFRLVGEHPLPDGSAIFLYRQTP